MDAVKFIEERNRMCGTMSEVWGVDAAQIVKNTEEWAAVHPRKTRRLSPRVLDAGGGMMAELKPCPFCGYKGIMQRNGHCFRVYCPNKDCPIEPKTHWFLNHLLAIEAWNRRADNG